MKGKEMMTHQHGKKDCHYNQTTPRLMATMTTIKSLMAIITLMASITTSDYPKGLWFATCAAQPSQGKFANTGCKESRNGLLSPDGNFGVKRPAILEGLFEKSFCSTKQVSLFLHS